MLRILSIPLIVLSLALAACQTSPLKQFQAVTPGMEKADVLEIMGSPDRMERFHGKDRWTYIFYDHHIRFEKEVQFFEGNATYVGDIWQPPTEQSAYVVDQKHEVENKATDERIAKEKAENRAAYSKYEDEVRGQQKVLYVPQFEPIQ